MNKNEIRPEEISGRRRQSATGLAQKLALSIGDVVAVSGVGRTTIYAEIKGGRLAARKCGRRTVVLESDLRRWLDSLPKSVAELEGQP